PALADIQAQTHLLPNSQIHRRRLEHRRLLCVTRTVRSVRFSPGLTGFVEFDRVPLILEQKRSLSQTGSMWGPVHRVSGQTGRSGLL
ncbi:hypothetical protein PIB30_018599, partial [Stylosanthes scabra]|nr:hypothetical protein [Stylosanthes scabra]